MPLPLSWFTPGRRVAIGGRYLLTELNCVAEVVETRPPIPEAESLAAGFEPGDDLYPYGMVKLRLPEHVEWGCREPWFGPEDLGFAPGEPQEEAPRGVDG